MSAIVFLGTVIVQDSRELPRGIISCKCHLAEKEAGNCSCDDSNLLGDAPEQFKLRCV